MHRFPNTHSFPQCFSTGSENEQVVTRKENDNNGSEMENGS